ncbi:hypothetical protein K491DRAFT_766596 [Lophiostoma macrostomum CBS 122681]|uniref:Uncharacterized protein n=1 Tax=Lophiostoma macrostomum CBS 122681 TaxID=1314788 RepID=A0A6A6TGH5_9PLEO|nr:hypothetical protein K491DRAFT_766596 [Lophiostoma macrostomum CBS 122681]
MARLSGLASEHHVKGPGDTNRRRGRKPKNGSIDASQGTKRSASPLVEVSAPAKRTKRVSVNDHEQLEHELEDAVARSQASDTIQVEHPRRRRRHSEPLESAQDVDDDEEGATPPPATQPIHGLTPHLERVGAQNGKLQRRTGRQSMPAPQLPHVLPDIDETNDDGTKVQFSPLTATLSARKTRLLRRNHLSEEVNDIEKHKKDDAKLRKAYTELHEQLQQKQARIDELEYDLEAQRLGNIDMTDDRTAEMRQELQDTRQAMDDLRASSAYAPDNQEMSEDDDDNEPLMLVDPDELNVSQEQMRASPHPNGYHATRAMVSSQITTESTVDLTQTTDDVLAAASQAHSDIVPDRISDQAVTRFELEIEQLTQKLSQSRSSLRILSVELLNLHILDVGASTSETIQTWRHTLEDARETYEKLFGDITGMNNADFITRLVEDLKGLNGELLQKTVLAEKQNQAIKVLRTQYETTMGLLADSEQRLEKLNSENETEIAELHDRVNTLRESVDSQKKEIDDKELHLNALTMELEDKDTSLDRQQKSVVALEKKHVDDLAQLQSEHLQSERLDRATFEQDLQQKNSLIEGLEERINSMEAQAEAITVKVDELRQRNAAEIQLHLEQRVEELDKDRTNLPEASLDEANENIEDLNRRIHDEGIQANELRSKLFQVQQEKAQAIADLKDAAELQRQEHEELLATETLRRQDAEQDVSRLEKAVADLENEMTLLRDTAETNRNEQIAESDRRLEDLRDRFNALENSSKSTITALEATIFDLNNDKAALQSENEGLRDAAVVESESHKAEIAARDSDIQGLKADLEDVREEKSKVDKLNKSLEDRVNNTSLEVADIKAASAAQQATIENLQQVADKTKVIEEHTLLGEARLEYIVELEAQLEDMKQRFREQAEESTKAIDDLLETNRQTIARQEEDAAAAKKRTADALKAVDEMNVKGLHVKTKGIDLRKVAHGKITKVNEKVKIAKKSRGGAVRKRAGLRDSGFVEINDEEEELEMDEGVVG